MVNLCYDTYGKLSWIDGDANQVNKAVKQLVIARND